MFLYILAAGLMADAHKQSNEAMYSVGYFLCVVAFVMTIGCLIMAYKLSKISSVRVQKSNH